MKSWRARLWSAAPVVAFVAIALAFLVVQYTFENPEATPSAPPPKEPPEPTVSRAAPVALPPAASATTWSYYHGDSNLAGYVDLALPGRLKVHWRHFGEGVFAQPVVGDGNGLYACTMNGIVVALDMKGNERWSATLHDEDGAPEHVQAPIASREGMVFVPCTSGRLHALDATTGTTRWTYDVGGELLGSAQVFEPADPEHAPGVYVVNRVDGEVFYLEAATGRLRWRMGEVSRFDGSPALGDGALVFGSCTSALHIFPAGRQAQRRDVPLGVDCQIASGPAIAGGLAYSGSRCGRLVCMDLVTGQIIWSNESCPQEIFTTPAVSDDTVVFGGEDSTLYALERATGQLRWSVELPGVPSSPALTRGHVLVSARGTLHMLRLKSGEETWRFEVTDEITSPAIISGMVIVAGGDGAITAFGS